jgi:hypothetical protein
MAKFDNKKTAKFLTWRFFGILLRYFLAMYRSVFRQRPENKSKKRRRTLSVEPGA